MKLRFIFNPNSGRHRRNSRLLVLLRNFISARRLDADAVATEGPGHASVLAREAAAAGCLRIVAVGGDGTVNEVAQGLLHTQSALGLVPCGSGNGLARHLGVPASLHRAVEFAADPESSIRSIDTGTANGQPFFNVMGLGLDAEVSRRFNQIEHRGLPAYACTGLAAVLHRRSEHCQITTGGDRTSLDVLLITVANSDQYGNGAFIAPGARVDDGELDLVAVSPVGLPGVVALAARLFLGKLDRSPRVLRLRGRRFLIERSAAGPIHTDGECHFTEAAVDVAVLPGSLRVVAPSIKMRMPEATASSFSLTL